MQSKVVSEPFAPETYEAADKKLKKNMSSDISIYYNLRTDSDGNYETDPIEIDYVDDLGNVVKKIGTYKIPPESDN